MVKVKYIGQHQPQETIDIDVKKAKELVETGDWEYASKNINKDIESKTPIRKSKFTENTKSE